MTQSTSANNFGGGSSSGRGKVQYATVFVTEKSLTFQVHGVGKQSRATVDIQAGLFSEYFVAEQVVPLEDDDDDENNGNEPPMMEVIRGGEFGINLTTVLECLCVLGPNTLDRTTLCLSYDAQAAIFKIELLDQSCCGGSSAGTSSLNSGVIISNCAIPGMAVADDDDDNDGGEDDDGQNTSTLDYAFRSHPILARARIKSDFLKDAITELTDVGGSTSATIGISKLGLEFATFGHSTECHVVVPYVGNHPEVFVSLEGVGEGENVLHARSYPLHSILSAMRGLEIASETCITINANGMVAIQHQVLDQVGNGDPNYVDFIMCCLEDEYEDEEQKVYNATLVRGDDVDDDNDERVFVDISTPGSTQQSNTYHAIAERQYSQSQLRSQSQSQDHTLLTNTDSDKVMSNQSINNNNGNNDDDDSETDTEVETDTEMEINHSHPSQQPSNTASLFGTVADIGAASESTNRTASFSRNTRGRENKNRLNEGDNNDFDDGDEVSVNASPRKRRSTRKSAMNNALNKNDDNNNDVNQSQQSDYTRAEESEEENSLDVTATVATSIRRRSSIDMNEEDPSSSPQLMYGDTHLEASGDEDGI
jgi:hypothetical protein